MQIQAQCYVSAFHEPTASFSSKLMAAPNACWLALVNDLAVGYLITLPIEADGEPHLPGLSDTSPRVAATHPNWLYIHDMAVMPDQRGMKLGSLLITQALAFAHQEGIQHMGLIAVQGSQSYWQSFGFQSDSMHNENLQSKLRTFGVDAVFMVRHLAPHSPY